MACKDCEVRRKRLRDAIMHGRMAEALDVTVEGLRVMIGIDAESDHRKDAAPKADPVPAKATGKDK